MKRYQLGIVVSLIMLTLGITEYTSWAGLISNPPRLAPEQEKFARATGVAFLRAQGQLYFLLADVEQANIQQAIEKAQVAEKELASVRKQCDELKAVTLKSLGATWEQIVNSKVKDFSNITRKAVEFGYVWPQDPTWLKFEKVGHQEVLDFCSITAMDLQERVNGLVSKLKAKTFTSADGWTFMHALEAASKEGRYFSILFK